MGPVAIRLLTWSLLARLASHSGCCCPDGRHVNARTPRSLITRVRPPGAAAGGSSQSNNLGLINKDEALLFDGGIPEDGLSWRQLVTALLPDGAAQDLRTAGLDLYRRLVQSLASTAERNLFLVYAERYGRLGFDQPALIPQVWLHYDPKAAWQRDGGSPLSRQRMDFLLLLAGRRRVVIEVDGIHHYSDEAGTASPTEYAKMVRADRDLRLAGYEVYRFGGAELMDANTTRELLEPFLDAADVTLADGKLLPSADPSAGIDAVIFRGSPDRVRIFVHRM